MTPLDLRWRAAGLSVIPNPARDLLYSTCAYSAGEQQIPPQGPALAAVRFAAKARLTRVRADVQRRAPLYVLFLLLLLAVAPAGAQVFDRTDTQREIELGRQAARQVEKMYPLSKNAAYIARVQRIGSALVASLPNRAYPYEFKVLATPEFNAFCLPGGFMYVYEGLLTKMPNDDALAFVMAHEITHAAHRHWHRIMEKMKGITIAAILADIATGGRDSSNIGYLYEIIAMQYSREDEDDADKNGIETAWAAGFDPHGAVEASELMVKEEKNVHLVEYLRDHPPAPDRLKRMKAEEQMLKDRVRPAPSPGPQPDLSIESLVGPLPCTDLADNPWYPLRTGAEWTYEISANGVKSRYTVRVVGALRAASGPVYRAEVVLGKDTAVPCQYLTTATQVWRRSRPADASSKWQLDLAIPAAGDASSSSSQFALVGQEDVTTPCGKFAGASRVHCQSGVDVWLARGVGVVKRVYPATGVTETLISYKTGVTPKPP